MKKRDFLTVWDLSGDEILRILDRAAAFKENPGDPARPLEGRSVGMLFDKSSTRTRVSFEVGIHQLGGQSIFLTSADMQLGRGETVADTARVLSRYLDAMVIRTYAQDTVEDFAREATLPVINALTDSHHPCQALADLLTIREKKGRLDVRIAYVGDGNNVTHSLIQAVARVGARLTVACPEGHDPDPGIVAQALDASPGCIELLRRPEEAVSGADVVYTDTWVSMGQEDEVAERLERFRDFQVNESLVGRARSDAVVLHCLPAHRGQEITDGVMDGPRSAVFDQAENRLHTQKAVLEFLLPS